MTPKDIRRILFERDLTVAGLAKELGCRRQELSMTIRRARPYPEIRKKLAKKLRIKETVLFSSETAPGGR